MMMMTMCSLRENVLKCFIIIKCKDSSFGMEKTNTSVMLGIRSFFVFNPSRKNYLSKKKFLCEKIVRMEKVFRVCVITVVLVSFVNGQYNDRSDQPTLNMARLFEHRHFRGLFLCYKS